MIALSIDTRSVKKLKRKLRRASRTGVARALTRAANTGGRLAIDELQKQWNRDMKVRRRSFPRRVLKLRKARFTRRRQYAARVLSVGADELLRDQIKGGVRIPTRTENLAIPTGGTTPRQLRAAMRRGATVALADGRIMRRTPTGRLGKQLGVLRPRARIPRRWRIRLAVRRVRAALPGIAARALRGELARAMR